MAGEHDEDPGRELHPRRLWKGDCRIHPDAPRSKHRDSTWIAWEGIREILVATLFLGVMGWGAAWIHPLACLPFLLVWGWMMAFFRDPPRKKDWTPDEFCSAADGTVTEITREDYDERIGRPATRIGLFLSLFNVHVNRAPCSGKVRSIEYQPGEFLDARHPESGRRNESNTITIDPDPPMNGPVVVRQVAGRVARRIVCSLEAGDRVVTGQRFGLIKFGSRTEVIVPTDELGDVRVSVGQKVKGGLTLLARGRPTQGTPRPEQGQVVNSRINQKTHDFSGAPAGSRGQGTG